MVDRVINAIKYCFGLLVIITTLYIIANVVRAVELIIGFITLSFGVLTIIWTLIAKYSLSPKSTLRLFTNNFLACSIAVVAFSIVRVLGRLIDIPWLILVEFFFIFATFLFFLLAAYYMYSIGKEFGFEREARGIRDFLKLKKRNRKRISERYLKGAK